MSTGPIAIETRRGERPALRAPARVLRARARAAAQVLGLLLARRRRDARRRRGDDARAHLRPRRDRGRDGRARPRLRLGLALGLDRRDATRRAGSWRVSNSAPQKAFIDGLGHPNLEVVTADINAFTTERRFDRVVSVEMFEHMRNWQALLARVRGTAARRRQAVRARLLAPAPRLRVRPLLDGPPLLHRRDHASRRPDAPVHRRPRRRASTGA